MCVEEKKRKGQVLKLMYISKW